MGTKDNGKTGLEGFDGVLRKRPLKLFIATAVGGLGMWIVAGLWHNLLLPLINDNATAHHEGLGIGLIAYFILSFLLVYLYLQIYKNGSTFFEGVKIGIVAGVLWVFPHGLVMAGTHDTSIIYEIKNTLYHMVEQGIGGAIIFGILKVNKS